MGQPSTEALHPASEGLHARPGAAVLSILLGAQIDALATLRPALPALERAAEAGASALGAGRRVGYAGAGSAGLMALAECLELAGTFGIAPERTPMLFAGGTASLLHMKGHVEDDPDLALADLDRSALGAGDVLFCVSASGSTPYTLAVAAAARDRGITVVGIANVAGSALLAKSDIPVLIDSGAEIVAGSTRMGAATAQKVALNMVSVLVGIRLGHMHHGYMVNLVADNAKLVRRAAGIVSAIAGVPGEVAEAALRRTAGAVKPAILVAGGLTPEAAEAALNASEGHLSGVIA